MRFILDGRVIDEIPFFLDSGQPYKEISARIFLPEGDYLSLTEREQAAVQMQTLVDPYNKTLVDPYNKTPESNENNNSASFQFTVGGNRPVGPEGINPGITVDV